MKILLKAVKTSTLATLLIVVSLCQASMPALAQASGQASPFSFTKAANLENVATAVRRAVAEQNVPGYAIAIVQDGPVLFSEGSALLTFSSKNWPTRRILIIFTAIPASVSWAASSKWLPAKNTWII